MTLNTQSVYMDGISGFCYPATVSSSTLNPGIVLHRKFAVCYFFDALYKEWERRENAKVVDKIKEL